MNMEVWFWHEGSLVPTRLPYQGEDTIIFVNKGPGTTVITRVDLHTPFGWASLAEPSLPVAVGQSHTLTLHADGS